MTEPKRQDDKGDESELAREIAAIPDEPLLPVEKKLIVGSLVLGVALLGVLLWLSQYWFPAAVTR
jgi:hypothetical protein